MDDGASEEGRSRARGRGSGRLRAQGYCAAAAPPETVGVVVRRSSPGSARRSLAVGVCHTVARLRWRWVNGSPIFHIISAIFLFSMSWARARSGERSKKHSQTRSPTAGTANLFMMFAPLEGWRWAGIQGLDDPAITPTLTGLRDIGLQRGPWMGVGGRLRRLGWCSHFIAVWALSTRASGAKRRSAEWAVVNGRARSSPHTPCGIDGDAGALARQNERSLRKLQERGLPKLRSRRTRARPTIVRVGRKSLSGRR
jgi:hypothetical protein